MGATSEGMGHQIFVKCENDNLMKELIRFIGFLNHYIDSSVFLEVARRGYSLLVPLNPPLQKSFG